MIEAISMAFVALFKALIPFMWEKANEAPTAQDAPDVPANVRRRWNERLRRHKSSLRP